MGPLLPAIGTLYLRYRKLNLHQWPLVIHCFFESSLSCSQFKSYFYKQVVHMPSTDFKRYKSKYVQKRYFSPTSMPQFPHSLSLDILGFHVSLQVDPEHTETYTNIFYLRKLIYIYVVTYGFAQQHIQIIVHIATSRCLILLIAKSVPSSCRCLVCL